MMLQAQEGERRRFTAAEIERMVELGILDEDEPVELLEGELVVVSPQGPDHASLTVAVHRLLERAYGEGFHIRDHSPIDAGPLSRPEPDLAVVRGEPRDYLRRHPGAADVVLVIEMVASRGGLDRQKTRVYSRAGVGCYWIIDVAARRLEVSTEPTEAGYREVALRGETESIALPELTASLSVRELLP